MSLPVPPRRRSVPTHICEKCGTQFESSRSRQRFCSEGCRGLSNRTTAQQYSRIDGNLDLYLNRLLYKHNNIEGKNRDNLTRSHLLQLWERQGGKCAISGLPMTYKAKRGERFPFNASIDRIAPGAPYEPENIQLVCTVINSLMKDFAKEDFIRVCAAVAQKHAAQAAPFTLPLLISSSQEPCIRT